MYFAEKCIFKGNVEQPTHVFKGRISDSHLTIIGNSLCHQNKQHTSHYCLSHLLNGTKQFDTKNS